MTRITRSQADREFFVVSKIFSQNAQSQINDNEQKIQILNQKNNFHVNLDINVVKRFSLNLSRQSNAAETDEHEVSFFIVYNSIR
jgi:23S rRNA pseudoU1915 N3-methylase RlmH